MESFAFGAGVSRADGCCRSRLVWSFFTVAQAGASAQRFSYAALRCHRYVLNKDQTCDGLESCKNLLCDLDLVEETHVWPHLAEPTLTMDDLIAVCHGT